MAKTVTLVSPDGKDKREVVVDSKQDVNLRWDGYTPAESKQEAPKAASGGGSAPKA